MKLEIDENSFWLLVWSSVAFFICVFAISLTWINHLNEKQFIDAGYTRTTLAGSSQPQWIIQEAEGNREQ